MSNIKIQDVDQRVQYTATSLQTVFAVPFPFLANSDLVVYQNSTLLDLGTSPGEYGVTGAGNPGGGTVTLVTGATLNDIITIIGNQPIDRTSIYSATISNLTGSDLNNDFNREIIMLKQLWTTQNLLQLQYAPYAEVSQDETVTTDRWIPKLAALESWRMNTGGTAIETYQGLDVTAASGIKFLVQQADASVPSAQAMGALGTGIVKNTTSTGVQSISAPLTSIDGLTIAAQKMLVGSGADTYTLADLTTYSQTLLALANLGAWQAALGIPGGGTGVYLPLAGGTMTGPIVLSGAATAALNPVTLAQMQAAYSNQHDACLVASAGTDSLSTWTYDNGTAGVGATLTAPSNGATTFDTSVVPTDGDSVFVIEQDSNEEWHGPYTIVQGDGSNPTVLTRRADFDQASEMNAGDVFSVVSGDTYAGTQWMMSQTAAITVGTTAITFQQITGQGALLKANNLSDLLSASTARTNLGVAIDSDVQAYDAGLQSISGLTTVANNMLYATASDTYAVIAPANSSVMVSSAGGVPSWSTTLPSGLTIPGFAGSGTNSDITSMTGLTGYLQAPTGIKDANGNIVVNFGATASAVNYMTLQNNVTGTPPIFNSNGSDTNIGIGWQMKGDEAYHFYGTSTAPAAVRWYENDTNGSNYIGVKAPASIASNLTVTWKSASAGYPALDTTDSDAWTAFTPSVTGFVDPGLGFTGCAYKKIGKTCFVRILMGTSGTSNANTFTITGLPFTSAATDQYISMAGGVSGGAQPTYPVSGKISASTTVCQLGIQLNYSGWSATGTKYAYGTFAYETA